MPCDRADLVMSACALVICGMALCCLGALAVQGLQVKSVRWVVRQIWIILDEKVGDLA